MAQWLAFEEQCTQYLNNKFGHKAKFIHLGSSDSTIPDIRVETASGRKFYMDAKFAPAQCGQFVLLPDVINGCFVFSHRNKTGITPEVREIVAHMNDDFNTYKEAGTAGREIDLRDGGETFSRWIISSHLKKGSEFFITNDFTILPTQDFRSHFDVSAKYRVKRSGSKDVGEKAAVQVIRCIKSMGFPLNDYSVEGNKLYVYASGEMHNVRFIHGGFEYMFSYRGDRYEIRKLSNTFNANVIFTITKKSGGGLADSEFIRFLE